MCSLKILFQCNRNFCNQSLLGNVVPPPLTTCSGIVSCASSCCTLTSSWSNTDIGCPVCVRRLTSICCSGRHFRKGELFTVYSETATEKSAYNYGGMWFSVFFHFLHKIFKTEFIETSLSFAKV